MSMNIIRNGTDVQYRKVGRGYVRFHQCPEGYHTPWEEKDSHRYLVHFITGRYRGQSKEVWLSESAIIPRPCGKHAKGTCTGYGTECSNRVRV